MVARIAGMRNLRRVVGLPLRRVVGLRLLWHLLVLVLVVLVLVLVLLLLLVVVVLLLLVLLLLLRCRHPSTALGLHPTLLTELLRQLRTVHPVTSSSRVPPWARFYGPRPIVAQPVA